MYNPCLGCVEGITISRRTTSIVPSPRAHRDHLGQAASGCPSRAQTLACSRRSRALRAALRVGEGRPASQSACACDGRTHGDVGDAAIENDDGSVSGRCGRDMAISTESESFCVCGREASSRLLLVDGLWGEFSATRAVFHLARDVDLLPAAHMLGGLRWTTIIRSATTWGSRYTKCCSSNRNSTAMAWAKQRYRASQVRWKYRKRSLQHIQILRIFFRIHLILPTLLQLALPLSSYTIHQRSPITQTHLPSFHPCDKPDLLPPFRIRPSHAPHLRNELVPRLDRARKARLELLDVLRIAAAEALQQPVRGAVPAEQAVHDGAAEAHLLA